MVGLFRCVPMCPVGPVGYQTGSSRSKNLSATAIPVKSPTIQPRQPRVGDCSSGKGQLARLPQAVDRIRIEFRASIVIGSGSLSYEMIRALVERLPVTICPKWVQVKARAIACRPYDYV